jgi:hypothetical protein
MTIGTVIHGTLRPQDLIPTFLDLAREYAPEHYAQLCASPFGPIPAHAAEDDEAEWWHSEDAGYLLDELFDLLDENAPAYCVFAAHEGDGSDFGFCPDWPALCSDIEDGEVLKVDDLIDVPSDWRGLVLLVNDHGNATLYDEAGAEVWRAV